MATQDLQGKVVLLIAPLFFGYERRIIAALEARGARVHFHPDRPHHSVLFKIALRLYPTLLWPYAEQHFRKWLDAQPIAHCDVLLVIKGEGFSPDLLRRIQERFPQARRILYLWDSIANVKHTDQKLALFHRVLSFDPMDCNRYPALVYRPLFFSTPPVAPTRGKGLFFIGTLNGDRPRVLARVIERLSASVAFDYALFVRSKFELALRKLTDHSFRVIGTTHLLLQPLPAAEVSARMQQCNAVLDIEHPKQTGLTIRTFEVLAMGKKLVTTNQAILAHDFYDPSRICLIDRMAPVIPEAFLNSPPPALPEGFLQTYSLDGWLDALLAVD